MEIIDTVNAFSASSSVPKYSVGQSYKDQYGNVYVYVKAGSVALAKCKLVQAPVPNSDVTNVTVASDASVGDKKVVIDAGGAVSANAFAGGTLHINDATGEGDYYTIEGHEALSGAGELTVYIKEQLRTALTTDTSEATLTANPYNGVVVGAGTAITVGAPVVAIGASEYGFIAVKATIPLLISGTPAIGNAVINSSGACAVASAVTDEIVGVMAETGVDTEYKLVKLSV